jgi:ribosome-binding protein aMBF1 (putative translation factor)
MGGPSTEAPFSRMLELMEVCFSPELEAKVKQSAIQQGRNPDELVQELGARHFEQETRFMEAAERGESLPHDEVGRRLARFLRP